MGRTSDNKVFAFILEIFIKKLASKYYSLITKMLFCCHPVVITVSSPLHC